MSEFNNLLRRIGIDPGAKGFLVYLRCKQFVDLLDVHVQEYGGNKNVDAIKVADWLIERNPDVIVLEDNKNIASLRSDRSEGSMNKWQQSKCQAQLYSAAVLSGSEVMMVPPQTWKASSQLTTQDKDMAREMVRISDPDGYDILDGRLKKDLDRCEAALIGIHGAQIGMINHAARKLRGDV